MKTAIISTLLCVVAALPGFGQLRVEGGTVTSGFTSTPIQDGYGAAGAVAQPFAQPSVDALKIRGGVMEIGQKFASSAEYTAFVLPHLTQKVGDTFNLDITYAAPCTFFQNGVKRKWRMELTFSRSIIEPLSYVSIGDDGLRYTIAVEGETDAANGTLVSVPLLARLGNDTTTPVSVTRFEWIDIPRQYVTSTPGSVTLNGLCETYGETRLVEPTNRPIVHIAPNPVHGSVVSIQVYGKEEGVGKIMVLDVHGNLVRTFQNIPMSESWPVSELDLGIVASGTYSIIYVTPTAIGRATLVKLP